MWVQPTLRRSTLLLCEATVSLLSAVTARKRFVAARGRFSSRTPRLTRSRSYDSLTRAASDLLYVSRILDPWVVVDEEVVSPDFLLSDDERPACCSLRCLQRGWATCQPTAFERAYARPAYCTCIGPCVVPLDHSYPWVGHPDLCLHCENWPCTCGFVASETNNQQGACFACGAFWAYDCVCLCRHCRNHPCICEAPTGSGGCP